MRAAAQQAADVSRHTAEVLRQAVAEVDPVQESVGRLTYSRMTFSRRVISSALISSPWPEPGQTRQVSSQASGE